MKRILLMTTAAMLAAFGAAAPGHASTTVNWAFSGTNSGSGLLTYDASNIVTAFSGTYDGQALAFVSFTADPNNPGANLGGPNGSGEYTYHGVPNTGGADYIFDNALPLDGDGILASTGTGAAERVYDISLFNGTPSFFSINSDGGYVVDQGSFATSAVASAAPEPATWALMIGGFGLAGTSLRRRTPSRALATA